GAPGAGVGLLEGVAESAAVVGEALDEEAGDGVGGLGAAGQADGPAGAVEQRAQRQGGEVLNDGHAWRSVMAGARATAPVVLRAAPDRKDRAGGGRVHGPRAGVLPLFDLRILRWHYPDLHRLVQAGAGEALAVGAERHAEDAVGVAAQQADLRAAF